MKVLNIDGNNVYFYPSTKFKTILLGVLFSKELEEKDLSARALLSKILTRSSEKYPSEQKMLQHLQKMYDMKLASFVSKRGMATTIGFFIDTINSHYLDDANVNLLDESFKLLDDIINHPNFQDKSLATSIMETERRLIIDDISSIYNNKGMYAMDALIKNMFATEKYHYRLSGELEDVKKVTLSGVMDCYQELIRNNLIEVFIIGDVTEEDLRSSMKNLHLPDGARPKLEFLDLETKGEIKQQELSEEQDINQSKLCMGYRTEIRYVDSLYYPMLVFNGCFGRYFHSRLVNSVREKNSLAYYITTNYDERKGVITLTSGINGKDYLKTVSLISEELEKIKAGDLSDAEIEITKKSIINEIWNNDDNQFGLFGEILVAMEGIKAKTKEEKIGLVNKVTREQVEQCAKSMVLDTIFLLKGTSEAQMTEEDGSDNDEEDNEQ